MQKTDYLILPLLQAFCWFDDGMQAHFEACGWTHVTRPQSMVMLNVLSGQNKPSTIARNMGISRQAAHVTIAQLEKLGMVEMIDDPDDGRAKIVRISAKGLTMRADADRAVAWLTDELRRRIGKRAVDNLFSAFQADWGDVPIPALEPAAAPARAEGKRKKAARAANA